MKIIKSEDGKFYDEATGSEVTWQDVSKATDKPRCQARILLKKLAAEGVDLHPTQWAEWGTTGRQIWLLQQHLAA